MKKSFILIIALFLTFSATEISAQKVRFGVQFGLGGAMFGSSNNEDQNDNPSYTPYYGLAKNFMILSYGGNLYASINVYRNLSIAFEPGIVRKGNRIKQMNENTIYNQDTQLDYLQLPVLLEYKVFNNIHFVFGPEFNYLLKARLATKQSITDALTTYNNHRFDFGLQLGLFYSLTRNLDLGFSTSSMLTDIEKIVITNANEEVVDIVKNYNFSFQVFLRCKI